MMLRAGICASLLCGVMVLGAPGAKAGFEFNPPAVKGPAPQEVMINEAPQVSAMPAAQVDEAPLSPPYMPDDGFMPTDMSPLLPPPDALAAAPLSQVQKPQAQNSYAGQVNAQASPARQPMVLGTLDMAPQNIVPRDVMIDAKDASGFAIAEGFGSDIPLALAMRQIVPDDFAYSFENDAVQGLRVNWTGGKAWDVVLNEALRPHGLTARVQNNTVLVGAIGSAPAPVATHAPSQSPAPTQTAMITEVPVAALPPVRKAGYISSVPSDEAPGYTRRKAPRLDDAGQSAQEQIIWSSRDNARMVDAKNAAMESQVLAQEEKLHEMNEVFAPVNALRQTPVPAAPYDSAAAISRAENLGTLWQASAGDSLHDTLTAWGRSAGIAVYWNTDEDFKLPSAVSARGSFTQGAEAALALYSMYDDRPVGRLYNQPDGTSVLIVDYYTGAVATN